MNAVVQELGQELNRSIVEEVKVINARLTSGELTEAQIKGQLQTKKLLNQERIAALGLYLIPGGKYE